MILPKSRAVPRCRFSRFVRNQDSFWIANAGARDATLFFGTGGDERFPDIAVNSLLAPDEFPVLVHRENGPTGAESLRNSSGFGAETGRIRRDSLYFPADQGIPCGDGFSTDSLLRHSVRGCRDLSREVKVSPRKSRDSAGFWRSRPVDSEPETTPLPAERRKFERPSLSPISAVRIGR